MVSYVTKNKMIDWIKRAMTDRSTEVDIDRVKVLVAAIIRATEESRRAYAAERETEASNDLTAEELTLLIKAVHPDKNPDPRLRGVVVKLIKLRKEAKNREKETQ